MVTVLCVAPFNSPHILPTYDRLAEIDGLNVTRACWGPLPPQRLSAGWSELPEHSEYLQPWRKFGDKLHFTQRLLWDEIVILPGFFHYSALPLQHYIRRVFSQGLTLLWSEPFLAHPRTSHSPALMSVRRLLLRGVNSTRYHFLAMGEGADRDYAKLGITKWCAWEFCFSVQMPDRPASHRRADENLPVQILYCGVLEHRKGPDLLVRALSDPSLRDERWILKVLGSGSMAEKLGRQVRDAGLSERVRFYGTLGINDTRRILFDGDILVLPSRFDGWGAVVNEAMSAGLSVVASSHVGAARTMINDGTDGFLFPSGDHIALAKVLRTLATERSVLTATKERALAKSRLFSPQTAAFRLSELCKALAAGEDPPAWEEGPCRPLGRILIR